MKGKNHNISYRRGASFVLNKGSRIFSSQVKYNRGEDKIYQLDEEGEYFCYWVQLDPSDVTGDEHIEEYLQERENLNYYRENFD